MDIRASAKLIKHVSTGVYRSPANALKELVSNAFDAGASRVKIDTSYPVFDTITVEDDGKGMSEFDVEFSMTHIGGSLKRDQDRTVHGRPIVGMIGIGLLAVGQAANQFIIQGAPKGQDRGVEALIDLKPFFTKGPEVGLEQISLGTVRMKTFDKKKDESYTIVKLAEVQPTFAGKLKPGGQEETGHHFEFFEGAKLAQSYRQFVDWIAENDYRVGSLSGYNQLLWELGILAPVKYFDDGPIKGAEVPLIEKMKKRLNDYSFDLFVDGIEIRKPIMLPNSVGIEDYEKDYWVYPLEIDERVGPRRLRASGYYYHQVKNIKPPELRGLLPRVRDVGVGSYDNAFFRLIRENPIWTYQLTGEIYVDEGLEDALNIDRNGFFESDDVYLRLKGFLEERVLNAEDAIVKSIKKRLDEHRERLKEGKLDASLRRFRTAAGKCGLRGYSIELRGRGIRPVVSLDTKGKVVNVSRGAGPLRRQVIWETFVRVLIAYEAAKIQSKKQSDMDRIFKANLRKLFDERPSQTTLQDGE